ncbi:MAG: DUF6036 family nucleotidyltransferase [Candidatus Micrarchaeota archaeon]
MRLGFGREKLLAVFEKIGARLHKRMEVFLLGGGAMCFRDQKNATKDLDLVFETRGDYHEFVKVMDGMDFKKHLKLEREYERLEAASIWQNAKGFRFDLFVKTVCNALSISGSMRKRCELLGRFGKLTVRMVSNEDVILFKGITQRPDDVNDIAAIVRTSKVNWDIILHECVRQSRARPWYGLLYDKLVELKEKHGIDVLVAKQLLKLDRESMIKEAYANLCSSGIGRKETLEMLRKKGFTKKELSFIG